MHMLISISESMEQENDLQQTSAPMFSCLHNEDSTIISIAPAEGNRPISIFDTEVNAFPYHFPSGKNGLKQYRDIKLGTERYFNTRLFSSDNRFASDPEYIFFALDLVEKNKICQSTSIAFRKGASINEDQSPVTAAMLTDEDMRKKILKKDLGYRFLEPIRGSPPYWEKTLKNLFGMVRQLGTPTWFCSFSAADRRWIEIPTAILRQQHKDVPEELSWTEHCKIINSNPVTACRMFEERVRLFIRDVLLSSLNPIGNIIDYFYRVEFQSRGWPHIHCLFWIKDAPTFSEEGSNVNFIKMIDNYVCATLPDPELEPELHEIVTSVQVGICIS